MKQRTNIHNDKLNTFNLLGDHRDKLNESFCLGRETQNVEHDTMRKLLLIITRGIKSH